MSNTSKIPKRHPYTAPFQGDLYICVKSQRYFVYYWWMSLNIFTGFDIIWTLTASHSDDWSVFIKIFVYKELLRFSLKSTSLAYWSYYSDSKCLLLIEGSWLLCHRRDNFSSFSRGSWPLKFLKRKDQQEEGESRWQMRKLEEKKQKCSL